MRFLWLFSVYEMETARFSICKNTSVLTTLLLLCACGGGDAGGDAGTQGGVSQMPTVPAGSAASGAGAGAPSSSATGGSASPASSGGAAAPSVGTPAQPTGGGTGGSPAPDGGAPPTGGSGGNQDAGMSGSSGGADGSAAPSGMGFGTVAVGDLSNDGPYMTMTVDNTGPNNNYTIYRPQQLAPGGAKNPFIAWISGGGSSPSDYTLLPHLASHGFVVVASNTVPNVGQQQALGMEMVAAVDWMLAEIQRSGSDYAGKVDGTKVAAMGYSMGGLAATAAGADPRWTTTVHISGGAGDGTIKNLHAPAAMLCGASGVDIAGANCATDFDQATTPMFYGVFNGGDHLGVRTPPYSDRIAAVVTGWLRWQLMDDQMLKPMFVGATCTLCTDPNWTVQEKNLQ
jgi:hypothetical protein